MAPNKPLRLPLAVAEVDRAAHLRSDESYLTSSWPTAQVLIFTDEKFATKDDQLFYESGASLGQYQDQNDYFLGTKDSKAYFVRHLQSGEIAGLDFKTLRQIGASLSPTDIGLAVHAQALANWHTKHPRCSQ